MEGKMFPWPPQVTQWPAGRISASPDGTSYFKRMRERLWFGKNHDF